MASPKSWQPREFEPPPLQTRNKFFAIMLCQLLFLRVLQNILSGLHCIMIKTALHLEFQFVLATLISRKQSQEVWFSKCQASQNFPRLWSKRFLIIANPATFFLALPDLTNSSDQRQPDLAGYWTRNSVNTTQSRLTGREWHDTAWSIWKHYQSKKYYGRSTLSNMGITRPHKHLRWTTSPFRQTEGNGPTPRPMVLQQSWPSLGRLIAPPWQSES